MTEIVRDLMRAWLETAKADPLRAAVIALLLCLTVSTLVALIRGLWMRAIQGMCGCPLGSRQPSSSRRVWHCTRARPTVAATCGSAGGSGHSRSWPALWLGLVVALLIGVPVVGLIPGSITAWVLGGGK